jgi:phosphomevalonate kinase
MNINRNYEQIRFVEEQLFETKQALFSETSVKRIKFLQSKINYLSDMAKDLRKK